MTGKILVILNLLMVIGMTCLGYILAGYIGLWPTVGVILALCLLFAILMKILIEVFP